MNDAHDVLRALDLPQEALAPLLDHIAQFCHEHGGERHYAELLAMVARLRAGL
ncbi:MAG: hypothetical protein V4484_15905 [Pseudomonadota bacterium]